MISTANKYALKLEDVCSHVGTFELKNISFERWWNVLSVGWMKLFFKIG